MSRKDCNDIYNQTKTLTPSSPASWDKLRDLIQKAKDIANEHNIIMYNTDFDTYYKLTRRGDKNGSAKNFNIARDELRSTALHMSSKFD